MIEPAPPMTACELHDLFNRYVADEHIAQIRLRQADYCERRAVDRLEYLRRRWHDMGLSKREEWRP